MVCSVLPTIPLIVFGVIEPLLLIWAYIAGTHSPLQFLATQSPSHPLPASAFTPQAEIVTLLLLNVYLLLGAVAVVCSFTKDAFTAKFYLFCVALADWGHIWAVYKGLGEEVFWDWKGWNDQVWGGVGASVVLNVLRWCTLVGVFGAVGGMERGKGKTKGA